MLSVQLNVKADVLHLEQQVKCIPMVIIPEGPLVSPPGARLSVCLHAI